MIVFLIDAFEKVYFEKKSADDNEVLNSLGVQRVIASGLIEIIHVSSVYLLKKKNVCQIQINMSMCTQNKE